MLESAKASDYAGYSKFDALNSPFLKAMSLNSKWLRLIYTQALNRSPFNLRPLFGVRKGRNPKGIALFARGYLFLFQATGDKTYLNEADRLIKWLIENPSPGYNKLCWGYNFLWQNTIFLQHENSPNVVVTATAGEALLHAYRLTHNAEYLKYAESVLAFLLEDVPVLKETRDEMAINYVLTNSDAVVLNINSLAAGFIIKMWKELANESFRETAIRLLNYTANRRTIYYAWFYTDPPSKSPIRHDNYHTGFILDAFLDYFEETGDDRFMEIYWKGLHYYQTNLFEDNGAPRWMSDRKFPQDIHGAAQGIITFSKASQYNMQHFDMAKKITDWAIGNLYRPERGDFAYRIGKYVKWNYSLMRWCNGWMARALGEVLGQTED